MILLLDCLNAGNLGDLGKFEKTVPKKHVEKKQVKKPALGRGKEKTEGSVAPPLVPQASLVLVTADIPITW